MAEIRLKMTPQEAIKRIEEHNRIHFATEGGRCLLITEALKMAVAALEKQIPKKPTHYDSVPHDRCPACHDAVKVFADGHEYHYCLYCGQKLDWGDDNAKSNS